MILSMKVNIKNKEDEYCMGSVGCNKIWLYFDLVKLGDILSVESKEYWPTCHVWRHPPSIKLWSDFKTIDMKLLSAILLIVFMFTYAILGGIVFHYLESGKEADTISNADDTLKSLVCKCIKSQ